MDALGHITRYQYDYEWKNELEQNVFRKTTIDPLENKTVEIFDAYHRLNTIEKRSSKDALLAKTVLRYDALGNKTLEREFVYVDGELTRTYVIEWTYTPTGLVETCTEQSGCPEEKRTCYAYTHGGLLDTITKPDGVVLRHSYDALLRLVSMKASDGSVDYSYQYDLNDNILAVCDETLHITHTKTYDSHDRIVTDTLGTGVSSSFSYDALDRVTSFALSSGQRVEYLYADGSLRDVVRKSDAGQELYTHRYESFDLLGNVTKSSLIASCGSIQQNWDPLGRLERTISPHFEEKDFRFDDAGNLLGLAQKDPQGQLAYSFAYDDLYQLAQETGLSDVRYKSDSLCNRLKRRA